MDPDRLKWLRELIRSIPGYGTAKRTADRITDASLGAFDAAQTFGTRTIADAEGSYNFFAPEAIESDYFGQLEEDTARRLAEEDRSGLRRGAQVAGELGLTGAEYIGLGGAARKGATGVLRREVAEEGAGRLSRMGVSAREALRDAAAVAPLDAVSAAREGHSTADAISEFFPESAAGRIAERVDDTAPGRMLSEMLLGLGADVGIRGAGHAIGATGDAARGLRNMGERGSLVLPEKVDLFGNPVEPTVEQADIFANRSAGTTAAQDRALQGRGLTPEDVAARSTGEVPEGETPLDLFEVNPAAPVVETFPKTKEGRLAAMLTRDAPVTRGLSVDEIDAELRRLNNEYDDGGLEVDEDEWRETVADLHRQRRLAMEGLRMNEASRLAPANVGNPGATSAPRAPSVAARPTIDHTVLSPSGRVSKRAREAAMQREKERLFPPGYWDEPEKSAATRRAEDATRLRASAQNLRDLAARGMSSRKFEREAARLEAQAAALEAGFADPSLVAGIARAGAGATAGAAVAPEGEKLEGALAGGALAAGAPALARGLRGMDEVGGWLVNDPELVAKFRAALTDLDDDEVIARYQKYARGRALTESDATTSLTRDVKRRVDDSGNVYAGTRSSESGMKARGRDTQQRARLAAAEQELEARGLDVPKDDPYLDVKPSQVQEKNRDLVKNIAAMSDDELHAEIVATLPKANPTDNVAMERMAILNAEASRPGREVDLDRAMQGQPPVKRPGVAPAFQKAPPPPNARIVSLRKADAAAIRESLGIDELPPGERLSMEDAWDEASERGMAEHAVLIAQDAVAGRRGLRPVEHAAAVQRLLDLEIELADSRNTLELAARAMNDDVVRLESNRTAKILEEFDTLTRAVTQTGSESARSLAARRWMKANADNWSFAAGVQEARTLKGMALAPDELRVIDEVTNKVKALEAENQTLKANNDLLRAARQEEIALGVAQAEAAQARRQARSANRIKELEVEGVSIKAQLAKLGVRLNDLTGVSAEGIYLIGKLAKNHIQRAVLSGGRADLNEIVEATLRDLNNPAITARDIHEALNARSPKAVSAQRQAVTQQIAQMKRQARLLTQIEDAENGIFQPSRKRPVTSGEIQKLKGRLTELRQAAYEGGHDARRIEATIRTINDLQDHLDNHSRALRKGRPIPSEELANLQTRVKGLRQEMRVEDRLTDLQEQLRTGEFKMPVPRETQYTSPALERNQIALKKAKQEWRQAVDSFAPMTTGRQIGEVGALLRTMKATADMSATMRQAFWLSTRRPVTAATAFGQSARAFFSSHTAEQIDNAIRQSPNQFIREKAGLHLADVGGPINQREEYFASNLVKKIPVLREVAAASERSMSTTLNLIRTAAFDDFAAKFPNATQDELQAWAHWINVATGRGDLPLHGKLGEVLKQSMFAPRFAASRIQTPAMLAWHWKQPRVRREIAKDYAAVVGTGMTALFLADLAGLKVGTDPDDPDFGKIRFGDTRVDIWAGVQQPARLVARVLSGTGERMGLVDRDEPMPAPDPLELLGRFAAFKLAPAVTLPLELMTGRDAVGQPKAPSETAVNALLPILFQDIRETYAAQGPQTAAISAGLNFLGVSTQTYADSEAQTRRRIRASLANDDVAAARQLLQEWNKANPDNPIRRVQ